MPDDITTPVKRPRGRPKGVPSQPNLPPGIAPVAVKISVVCQATGYSASTVKALAAKGEIEFFRDGRSTRYLWASVLAYVERRVAATKAEAADRAARKKRLDYPNLKQNRTAPPGSPR